jgi:hypothetical protein
MPKPVSVGADVGSPAKGFELFYDTARVDGCRVCHRLNGNDGPVGIDLADLGTSVLEIYGAIAAPKMASDNFPSVEIVTAEGTRHVGVKKSETGTVIRYFDIASTLPVLRHSHFNARMPSTRTGRYNRFPCSCHLPSALP